MWPRPEAKARENAGGADVPGIRNYEGARAVVEGTEANSFWVTLTGVISPSDLRYATPSATRMGCRRHFPRVKQSRPLSPIGPRRLSAGKFAPHRSYRRAHCVRSWRPAGSGLAGCGLSPTAGGLGPLEHELWRVEIRCRSQTKGDGIGEFRQPDHHDGFQNLLVRVAVGVQ